MTDHAAAPTPSGTPAPAPDDAESLLTALDPEQREVARSFGTPLCVLAGAGTGKTRAITHRIAYGVATGQLNPRHVLAVTFTAKAAAEMRSTAAGPRACPRSRPAPSTPPRCASCATSGHGWWAVRCRSC